MTATSPVSPPVLPRTSANQETSPPARSVVAAGRAGPTRPRGVRPPLGYYMDGRGRRREIITRRGFAGSLLVVDRDAATLGDRRLVAHLSADEPYENAKLVCNHYLPHARAGRGSCRTVTAEDATCDPLTADVPEEREPQVSGGELIDRQERHYRLTAVATGMSIPELRWVRSQADSEPIVVSLREVVASLESYEPACQSTRAALRPRAEDARVSTTVLRVELERVRESPIVLNRGLRSAVLARVERDGLSMSEIAIRCGRVKRDCKGNSSGETSWLARRLGLLPEGGHSAPTPWVHIEVLALIARQGLGISPREVEL